MDFGVFCCASFFVPAFFEQAKTAVSLGGEFAGEHQN